MARKRVKAPLDWQRCPCRVLGYAVSYAKACEKMALAKQTSHVESADSSGEDCVSPRMDAQLQMPTFLMDVLKNGAGQQGHLPVSFMKAAGMRKFGSL
ncbi:hypothetical protein V5799_017304 [Amblyomma americanum]|uniref:Uncharacterized protein n=1 Tax=Amblyomma americanum TaxID=6943 RepID=A0AAQ4F3U0_AMBAM